MSDSIYYLTGRGGKLNEGLGEGLLEQGFHLQGREVSGQFASLGIQQQIDLIIQDLNNGFLERDSKVIAVSYGAYLLLHTLLELKPFDGSILLFSPVLGGVVDGKSMKYFSPPRSEKLMNVVSNQEFPNPRNIEIHVGDSDWQSPYERVKQFSEAVDGECNVVANTGHQLGKDYVAPILERWKTGNLPE